LPEAKSAGKAEYMNSVVDVWHGCGKRRIVCAAATGGHCTSRVIN
jgi:hypothetical protein